MSRGPARPASKTKYPAAFHCSVLWANGRQWFADMNLKTDIDRSERLADTSRLTDCLSLIRGAWAPHVIWHLRMGPRRFSELRLDIPRLSNRVLSQRLKELEARGVISRTIDQSAHTSVKYVLTSLGHQFIPALGAVVEMGRNRQAGTG